MLFVLQYLSVFCVEHHTSATCVVLLLWSKAVTVECERDVCLFNHVVHYYDYIV